MKRYLIVLIVLIAVLPVILGGCLPTGVRQANLNSDQGSVSYSSDTRTPEQIEAARKAETAADPTVPE